MKASAMSIEWHPSLLRDSNSSERGIGCGDVHGIPLPCGGVTLAENRSPSFLILMGIPRVLQSELDLPDFGTQNRFGQVPEDQRGCNDECRQDERLQRVAQHITFINPQALAVVFERSVYVSGHNGVCQPDTQVMKAIGLPRSGGFGLRHGEDRVPEVPSPFSVVTEENKELIDDLKEGTSRGTSGRRRRTRSRQ